MYDSVIMITRNIVVHDITTPLDIRGQIEYLPMGFDEGNCFQGPFLIWIVDEFILQCYKHNNIIMRQTVLCTLGTYKTRMLHTIRILCKTDLGLVYRLQVEHFTYFFNIAVSDFLSG